MDRDEPEGVVRRVATSALSRSEIATVRDLLGGAFADDGEGFTEDDWRHATGGTHVLLSVGGTLVAHAAVVERELHVAGRPLRTGYVEAVATRPDLQGRGYGSRVVIEVNDLVRSGFELGALSTGSPRFYARLGWEPWPGTTAVRTDHGTVPTPDDDGGIMVLVTPATPAIDRRATISCPWRRGDVW